VSAIQGNLDSIPIVDGVGGVVLTDSEVEEFKLRTLWVSGDPPLQSPALESVESEVKLIATMPETAFVGGDFDTIAFQTIDGGGLLYPYDTWVSLGWEESNPNWSVIFSIPPDSIPITGGVGWVGIDDSEIESVTVHVFTDDDLLADRSSVVGILHFSTLGIQEGCIGDRMVHALGSTGPNPFSGVASISYTVGGRRPVRVRLNVYGAGGRIVRTLVDAHLEPGFYASMWNGSDQRGRRVGSGVYFYRLELGDKAFTRKAVFVR
jgi:hypothetical protein